MRRNLLLAQTLVRSSRPVTALLLGEAREINAFAMPAGVDCVSLPAVRRSASREIGARYLDIACEDLIRLRARTIRTVVEAFAPDVLIVDHLPRGAGGELDETLRFVGSRPETRVVLGLRDVLADPETVQREWWCRENVQSIRAHYDAIWIYGDPAVYDAVSSCHFPPEVSAKVRFTGYMDHRVRSASDDAGPGRSATAALSLCLLGGGQDGAPLARAFLQAELPRGTSGTVVAGPYMPVSDRGRLEKLASLRPRFRILDFVDEPRRLLSHADSVISMGGYNTTLEILSYDRRALLVPRVHPRCEQWIRAKRLEELGLVDVLAPDAATPRALSAWLAAGTSKRRRAPRKLQLDGLDRLPGLLESLLDGVKEERVRSPHDDVGCHPV